jgi:hypothetical protein
MPEQKTPKVVVDSHGNFIYIPHQLVVNGTVKHENDGKNPAYKSIHSTSINLPLKKE